jgi:AcrR family transcriptional regulator
MSARLTPKGISTKDRIVKVARNRLVEGGLDALVMREVADSLDIKLGNLQYYFKTRDDLILEIMEKEAVRDVATISQSRERFDDPSEALAAVVADLVARWRGRSGVLWLLLGLLAGHEDRFRQLYRHIYLRFYEVLESVLKDLNPALAEEEITSRVRLITALIDGSSMQIRVGDVNAYLDRVQQEAITLASGENPGRNQPS